MSPTRTGNVLNWASDIDPNALDQAQLAASMPFVDGPVALMPDAHVGMGATIGSVIPTRGAIIPSAVGVDIGCGMIAVECPFTSDVLPDNLDNLHAAISDVVPAGVGRGHDTARVATILDDDRTEGLSQKQESTAAKQLGSLGSGNHFVEVCLDERDRAWVVLHSGSRGIGNQLARQHIDGAKA
ncbi:MAG: RtcB family protein, partial [Candidatus Competibacteraceae bacterium]|nr:RtcB family protein [Candidatus Competibacteraceae bacterium]